MGPDPSSFIVVSVLSGRIALHSALFFLSSMTGSAMEALSGSSNAHVNIALYVALGPHSSICILLFLIPLHPHMSIIIMGPSCSNAVLEPSCKHHCITVAEIHFVYVHTQNLPQLCGFRHGTIRDFIL